MTAKNQRIAVVYRSKYGSTKKYAEWIASEVNADLFEGSQVKMKDLLTYDTIVFGGGLYAVGILGFPEIKKQFAQLQDKQWIVFAVGASPARKEAFEHVLNSNLTDEMKGKVQFFMLRGAFNYQGLNRFDRFLMWMMKLKLKSKKPEDLDADGKGMLASYGRPVDWTNKKAIQPIIACINGAKPSQV